MVFKTSNLEDAETKSVEMVKRGSGGETSLASLLQEPAKMKAPGLRETKKVELYTKYRPLIPAKYQDELCPQPDPAVLKRVGDEKKQKAKQRREAKKPAK